jgi:uridine kinase
MAEEKIKPIKNPLAKFGDLHDLDNLEKRISAIGVRHYQMRGRNEDDMRDFDGRKIFSAIYGSIINTPGYENDFIEGSRFHHDYSNGNLNDQELALRVYELVAHQIRAAFPSLPHPPDIESVQDMIVETFTETGLISLAKHFQLYRGAKRANRFDPETGKQNLNDIQLKRALFGELGIHEPTKAKQVQLYKDWGCSSIAALNEIVQDKQAFKELILSQNDAYISMMQELAEQLVNDDKVKAIVFAGPSSSGKTGGSTTLARMMTLLGVPTQHVEVDMYFWTANQQPMTRQDAFNYEQPVSIRLRKAGQDLVEVLQGYKINFPHHNFGVESKTNFKPFSVAEGTKLMIDSHMGLNPNLVKPIIKEFGEDAVKIVYIENYHGFENVLEEDIRFLRRMVRDVTGRGHSPYATAQGWFNVEFNGNGEIKARLESADYHVSGALAHDLPLLMYAFSLIEDQKIESGDLKEGESLFPNLGDFMTTTNSNPDAYVRLHRIANNLITNLEFEAEMMMEITEWMSPFDAAREFIRDIGLPEGTKIDLANFPTQHVYGQNYK